MEEHSNALSAVQAELEAAQEFAATAASSAAEAQGKVAELESQLGGKEAALQGVHAELASLKESASGEASSAAEAEGKVAELESKLGELEVQLSEEVAKGEAAVEEHGNALSAVQTELEEAKEFVATEASSAAEAQGKMAELKGQLSEKEAALQDVEALQMRRVESASSLASDEANTAAEMKAELFELESKLCLLQGQLGEEVAKCEEHSKALSAVQAELEAAQEFAASEASTAAEARFALNAAKAELEAAQEFAACEASTAAEVQGKLAKLQAKYHDVNSATVAEDDAGTTSDAVDQAHITIEDEQAQVAMAMNTQLQEECETARAEADQLKAEAEELKAELAALKQQSSAQVAPAAGSGGVTIQTSSELKLEDELKECRQSVKIANDMFNKKCKALRQVEDELVEARAKQEASEKDSKALEQAMIDMSSSHTIEIQAFMESAQKAAQNAAGLPTTSTPAASTSWW